MWLLLIGAASAAITGAVHVAHPDGDGIRWETTLDGSGFTTLSDGSEVRVAGRTRVVRVQPDKDGLRPPMVPGLWQRIDLVGLEWTPDAALGLERRVDCWAPPAFGGRERARLELIDPHLGFSAYVDGSEGVLPGEVRPRGGVDRGVALASGAAFAGAVVLLTIARRLLARHVIQEEADAYMAEEFLRRR
jgi:hypothetical protein